MDTNEAGREPTAPERPQSTWKSEAGRGLLLFVLVLPLRTFAASPRAGSLLVWDFELGVTNRWEGRYNVFQRTPSWARIYLDPDVNPAASRHSLRVTVHREDKGFCGIWMEFYPHTDGGRRLFDASPYRFLSFLVKGQKGGEDFEVQLVDTSHENRDDSIPSRSVKAYLAKGVTTEWQEVLVPLADFRGLNLRRLVQLNLKFTAVGDSRFYLDALAFKPYRAAPVAPQQSAGDATTHTPGRIRRAVWAWNVRNLFDPARREEEMKRFFGFCSENQIEEVYLALIFDRRATPSGTQFELRYPEAYRAFLERAHQQHITVEALAGSAEWAVRANHPLALSAVNAVLVFNRSAPAAARFDGIHFDVEPYSLLGFTNTEYRTEILGEFLEMITACAERAKADSNLRFGCDVPAWFYPTEGLERRRLLVTFRGEDKTVGEHLTDLLDDVTIMDYHNAASGSNGIIAAGLPALKYAASKGKKVVIGLETSLEQDREIYFVCGLPIEEFQSRVVASKLRGQVYLNDFRISVLSHETHVHVGLAAPDDLRGATREAFWGSLLTLARELGAASDPERFPLEPILEEARMALENDPEWKGFEIFEFTDPDTSQPIKGFHSGRRMLRQTTFYGLGREVFAEETRSAVEWLGHYNSFDGLAIHFYDSYRELIEGR